MRALLFCVLAVALAAFVPLSEGSLTYLDPGTFQTMLTNMWKKDLNTNDDPANGKWYTNGANGDGVGLYGGLTDDVDHTVYFDQAHKGFSTEQFVATSATVDNTNGLTPSSTVQLTYQHSTSTSQSHTSSNAFKAGTSVSVKASATIFGIGADITTSFSFDYTYTTSQTTSSTTSDAVTFSQSVPVTVPKGKIYKAVLTGTKQTLTVPTTTKVTVTGRTETWFASRIDGHFNWDAEAGEAFGNINKWGLAGSASSQYSSSGDTGVITTPGTITGVQSVNFQAKVIDATGFTEAEFEAILKDIDSLPAERLIDVITF